MKALFVISTLLISIFVKAQALDKAFIDKAAVSVSSSYANQIHRNIFLIGDSVLSASDTDKINRELYKLYTLDKIVTIRISETFCGNYRYYFLVFADTLKERVGSYLKNENKYRALQIDGKKIKANEAMKMLQAFNYANISAVFIYDDPVSVKAFGRNGKSGLVKILTK